MKRKLLVVGLIISSLMFAEEFNNKNKTDGKGQGIEMPMGQQSNLTDSQKKDLQTIITKHHKLIEPLMLTMEEKDLAIRKELLADKVNWNKVESILKEKAVIEGQIEMHMLKNRMEIQEKFGDVFKFDMGNMPQGKGFQVNNNFDNQGKDMKNNNSMDKMSGMKDNNLSNEMINLTEAQQSEMKAIKDKYQKQLSNLSLSEEEKEIAIKKEMLADKLNWEKIELLTKEKSSIKGQKELLILQERNELKSKLGIEFMDGFDKGLQGKFNPNNMENGKGKM